jgi:hypothetical protein
MFNEAKYQKELAEEEERNRTRRTVQKSPEDLVVPPTDEKQMDDYDRRLQRAKVRRIGPRST